MPFRCAQHKADRIRRQKASQQSNHLRTLPSGAKCPECGTPLNEVPFGDCVAHRVWTMCSSEEIARRTEERDVVQRATADRAVALLEALRDVYGIDLLSKGDRT